MSDLGDDLEPKDKRNLTTMVHYIIGERILNINGRVCMPLAREVGLEIWD